MKGTKAKKIILCGMFSALIAVGAFIRIPIPIVPFTLQFLFTMLAGLLLGKKSGFTAVLVYIAIGLMGIPVFTEGGGPSYVLKPTFGYIIGFALAAYVSGAIAHKDNRITYKRLLAAAFAGLAIVYICGMLYYYFISRFYIGTPIGVGQLFLYCFILAVPGDIVLCILGVLISKRLIPIIRKEFNL